MPASFPTDKSNVEASTGQSMPPGRPQRTVKPIVGFTVVELVIVLMIVAILSAIAAPMYVDYVRRATLKQTVVDIRTIETRVKAYRNEFGHPPTELTSAMKSVPRDPWGNFYRYLRIEGAPPSATGSARKDKNLVPINSDFDLYSMGEDGDSSPPLTAKPSHDDIVRANDGAFIGLATDY
jgi:general secretion pathway protein G